MFNFIKYNHNNNFIINTLFSNVEICKSDQTIKTRKQLEKITSSCRLWQLFYCVCDLFLRDGKYIETPEIQQQMCNIIYNRILESKKTPFYGLVVNNIPLQSLIEPITQNTIFDYGGNDVKTYYCCLYIPQEKIGHIFHYFNLIRDEIGEYYINNSYGSDYVCVPQYIKRLDGGIIEFLEFCFALPNIKENIEEKEKVINFMEKYFLETYISILYDEETREEDPSLRFKFISPEEGKKKRNKCNS